METQTLPRVCSHTKMEQITVEMVSVVVILTKHFSDSTCPGCRISLSVSIQNDDKQVNVKVGSSGFHSYPIKGSTLLSHLVKETFHLKQSCHSSMIRLLYNNNHNDNTISVVELLTHSMIINEHTQPRPLLFPGLLLEATEVPLLLPAKDVPSLLYQQLYLFRIINPHLTFALSATLTPSEIIEFNFEGEESSFSIPSSPFKLLSSIKHYLDLRLISTEHCEQTEQIKLKVLRGVTCTLQDYATCDSQQGSIDLKLYSAISILPELKLAPGRKLPADRICNQLHIHVFSSGNVPLISSGGHANFNLEDIASWSDYGVTIGPVLNNNSMTMRITREFSNDVPCTPSFSFQLRSCFNKSLLPVSSLTNHAIHLFLFVEPIVTASNNDDSLRRSLSIINGLRNDFPSLVKRHAKKLQRSCHSAMNKIFCNYSSFQKTKESVSSSLPLLAKAVNDIVESSQCKTFKTEAYQLLSEREANKTKVILDRLKDLAHSKIADRGPEEPTTPELTLSFYSTTEHIIANDHRHTTLPIEFDSLTQIDEHIISHTHSTPEHIVPNDDHTTDTLPVDFDSLTQIDEDILSYTHSTTEHIVNDDLTTDTLPVDFDSLTQIDEDILSLSPTEYSIELYQQHNLSVHTCPIKLDNTQLQYSTSQQYSTQLKYSTSQQYSTQLQFNTQQQDNTQRELQYRTQQQHKSQTTTNEQMVPEFTNSDHEWENELIMSPLSETVINSCLKTPTISESDFNWD